MNLYFLLISDKIKVRKRNIKMGRCNFPLFPHNFPEFSSATHSETRDFSYLVPFEGEKKARKKLNPGNCRMIFFNLCLLLLTCDAQLTSADVHVEAGRGMHGSGDMRGKKL